MAVKVLIGALCALALAANVAQASLLDDLLPDPPAPGPPIPGPPELAADVEITVQEKKKRFNPKLVRISAGTAKFTVIVPKSAKRKHGVGLDGGVYKDIDGAVVKPGRMTSLTIDLEPGRYVVYDSYKKNRRKGFRTKVIVE